MATIWNGPSSDYNADVNWTPASAPVRAGQSAEFTNAGLGTITVSSPVAPDAWTFDANAQTYGIVGDTLTFGGAGLVSKAASGTISIANVIAGTGGITQSGQGTLVLLGTDSYTGPTTITSGRLALSGTGSIAASSGVVDKSYFDISGLTNSGTTITTLSGFGLLILGDKALTLSAATGSAGGTFYGNIFGSAQSSLVLAGGTEVLGSVSKLNFGTVSSFQGTVALNAGTLELATVDALDRGLVRFGTGAQTLQLDLTGRYTNTVTGFDRGDVLDFRGLDPSSAAVEYNPVTHTLTVSSGGKSATLHFDAGYVLPTDHRFVGAADGFGGTAVTLAPLAASTVALFGTIVTDPTSQTGGIYGLYKGLLARAPDALGLEGFTISVQTGANLTDIANVLLTSPEYGQAREAEKFVRDLYTNLLVREADTQGLRYYTSELSQGVSRATVAVQLATSAEAQAVDTPAFQVGVFVPDAVAAGVARLYYGLLNRAPDAAGLGGFETQAKQTAASAGAAGTTQGLATVVNAILDSSEFASTHAGQTNAAYVDSLYVGALGRHADAAGAGYFAAELAQGVSRATVALQITESQEAQVHLVGVIEQGYQLAT